MKHFALILPLLLLSACTAPLTSQEMSPQFDFYDQLTPTTFEDKISVRNIEVAKGVGGAMPVTPEEFRAALTASLRQADLYSKEEEAKFFIDAHVVDMKQPYFGFNMTATTTADYTVYNEKDSVVFQEQVSVPCTKTMGDAFNGEVRARMASGCSVGENITHLIKVLSMK